MVVGQDSDNENGKKGLKKVEPTGLVKEKLTERLERRKRELKLTTMIYFRPKYVEVGNEIGNTMKRPLAERGMSGVQI